MWSNQKLPMWGITGAFVGAVVATGCIPPLRSRPTKSLPTAAWLKPGKQTRPSAAMRRLARKLRGASDVETIANLHTWVRKNRVRFRGSKRRVLRRRTAAELFESRTYSGCGDHGLVLATLLRAAGLPTVFVSSVQKDWARDKTMGTAGRRYMGHVFLEVYTAGGWVLVDSTKPLLWKKYDPEERNLPRGYYLMSKGYDSWDMGITRQRHLLFHMDNLVENTPLSRFRDVTLPQIRLAKRLVVITVRTIARRLKWHLRGVPIKVYEPGSLQDWLSDCTKCEAVALLPTDLSRRLVKAFFRVVGEYTRLPSLEGLVKSTPRYLALPKARLCLYVRDTTEELLRLARKHAQRPINADTCR